MSSTDAVPDRETLRANAVANQHKGRKLLLIVLAVLALLSVLSALPLLGRGGGGGAQMAVTALPVLVLIALTTVAMRASKRQDHDPQLSLGADRETQRAVARALRDGGTPDPRVDALARDAAERAIRRPWLIWLYVFLTVVLAALLVNSLVDGEDWYVVGVFGLLTVSQAVLVPTFWQIRRRGTRYLDGNRS